MAAPHQLPSKHAPRTARALAFAMLGLFAPHAAPAAQELMAAPPAGYIETGVPSFSVRGPESLGLGTAPFELRQLPDGRWAAATLDRLAIGDGVRWETFELIQPDIEYRAGIETLQVDERGDCYTGDGAAIARLVFTADGRVRRETVATLPPGPGTDRAKLVNSASVNGEWYWYGDGGFVASWRPGRAMRVVGTVNNVSRIFAVGSDTFVCDASSGMLYRIDAERGLVDVPHLPDPSNVFAAVGAARLADGRTVVGTVHSGLFFFDGRHFEAARGPEILRTNRINDLAIVSGGFLAIAVENFGILFLDENLRIVQTLDRRSDHRLAQVRRLVLGRDGDLWAVLSTGIVRIAFPSPVSHLEPFVDTGFSFAMPARHEGKLWLAADGFAQQGIYDTEGRLLRFERAQPPGRGVSRLVTDPATGHIVASTDTGLYQRVGDSWEPLLEGPSDLFLFAPSADGSRWFYGARDEIGWVRRTAGGYTREAIPVPGLGRIYDGVVDSHDGVWIERGAGKCARIDLARSPLSPRLFGTEDGIDNSWAQLFLLDGEARLVVNGRILRLDPAAGRFTPDTRLLQSRPWLQGLVGTRATTDSLGRTWIVLNDTLRVFDDGHPLTIPDLAGLRPYYFIPQTDGVVWMHRGNYLVRYDPSVPQLPLPTPHALISRVHLAADNKTLYPTDGHIAAIPYSSNSIAVHVCAPGTPIDVPTLFETLLEGPGANWAPAGSSGIVGFNRLREGTYALRVRPRVGDLIGGEARLAFTILPPWYRTTAAYLAYALSGVVMVGVIGWLAMYLERREKRRLAHLVSVRTADLAASQDRYRQLATELDGRVATRTAELARANNQLHATNTLLNDANTQLHAAKDAAETADKAKSAFLANMSHEIRTPLNGVIGMGHILLGTPLATDQKDLVDTLIFSGETLLSVINDVLDFSKIEAGRLVLESVDFDLHEQFERTLDLQAAAARKKGLDLVLDYDPRIPRRLRGDPVRLRQIVLNLLGNAIKFTERGAVVLRVLPTEPPAAGLVRIEVQDSGIGISAENQANLFQRFSQADSSTTRRYGGTGLGLAICRRLVDLMHGEIGVVSTPGEGSIFWIALPLVPAATPQPPPSLPDLAGRRVLVVDDTATNRKVFRHSLEAWGVHLAEADSGAAALHELTRAMAAGQPYELVLLDHQMPELDGLGVARAIVDTPSLGRPALVLLTSRGERPPAERLHAHGIFACEFKPISEAHLHDLVQRALAASGVKPTPPHGTAASPASAAVSTVATKVARILVAEDNAVNQKVALRFIKELGHSATLAVNGREALDLLRAHAFDLVLMDMQMPVMDGLEATQAIRQAEATGALGGHIPIIAMTANALTGDRETCLAAGMDDYVAKPLTPETVSAVMARYLAPQGAGPSAPPHA